MLSRRVRSSYLVMLAFLVGCAALTTPKSFDQQLAYAYGVHTAVLQAAATGVENGTLSVKDGETVLSLADQCRTILDTAKAAEAMGDVQGAADKLVLGLEILQNIQKFLDQRSG